MNKNFEEEYRKMMDSDIPDLWDRIEAQLPPQNFSAGKAPAKPLFFLRKNAAVLISAAAALSLLFLLPSLPRQKGSQSGPNSAAFETAGSSDGFSDGGSQPAMFQASQEEAVQSPIKDSDGNEGWYNSAADECCDAFPQQEGASPQIKSDSVSPEEPAESAPYALLKIVILRELKREQTAVWYLAEDLQDGGELILHFSDQPEAVTAAAPLSLPVCPDQTYAVLLDCPTEYSSDGDEDFPDISDGTPIYPVREWSPLEKNLKNFQN